MYEAKHNKTVEHYYLQAGKIYAEEQIIEQGILEIKQGKILAINPIIDPSVPLISLPDHHIIPGLIDLHIHGREGSDIMDGTIESINTISRSLAHHGVCGFLGTTATSDWQQTLQAFKNLGNAFEQQQPGAELLGAYNEGLFFTNEHKGAHNQDYFVELNRSNLDKIISAANGALKVVALAPERENSEAMISYLRQQGIRVMLGHTDANWQQTCSAIDAGACGGVHVFNGMRGIHHRDPGCAGAMLLDPDTLVEVIADGVHLHPAILDMIHRLKGHQNMALISDCINAGGLSDGQYRLGMMDVEVTDGIARTQSGSLAGSTLTLERAIHNLISLTDICPRDAIHMASLVPATFLGLDSTLGSITPGKQANLAVITHEFNVAATVINGHTVFSTLTALPQS